MVWVYILKSEKNSRYYIGSTDNLHRRIEQHRDGNVLSTKHIRPVNLVFSQEYEELSVARSIEYRLKKLKSRKIIDRIVDEGLIRIESK